MDRLDILANLTAILNHELPADLPVDVKITEETKLVEDLGLESFSLIWFTVYIESFYNIEITDEERGKLATIGQWIDLVMMSTKSVE